MAISFRLLPVGVEEQYFRRLPEGWLFAGSRPLWLLGPRPTYRVTDAQKPAIAARLRLNRYLRLLWGIGILAAVLLMARAAPDLLNSNSIWLWVLPVLLAVNAVETFSIRPLIAGLPQTAERMPVAEMLKHQTDGMSIKALTVLGLFFLAAALLNGYFYFTMPSGREFTSFVAYFSGSMAVLWFGMLVAKLRKNARLDADENR